jgi:hypothetical protein
MRPRTLLGVALAVCSPRAAIAQEPPRWTYAAPPPPRAQPVEAPVYFYFGGALGAPLPALWLGGLGEGLRGSLQAGYVFHHLELQLEVSPAATVLFNVSRNGSPLGAFDATVTVGGLVPMNAFTSWILRVGGGGGIAFAGSQFGGSPFGELRADVAGVAIRPSDHLRIEFNAPSYRLMFMSGGYGMSWITSLGVHYVF